ARRCAPRSRRESFDKRRRAFGFLQEGPESPEYSRTPITGLQPGEQIESFDFRPKTGQLYGISSQDRIYTIDPATAVATQVGTSAVDSRLHGEGFDFDPVRDQIRSCDPSGRNARIDPNTGTVIDSDPNTPGTQFDADAHYVDGTANSSPSISSIAYTNNLVGATSTTLYGIDYVHDTLVRQGNVNDPLSPDRGEWAT